MAVEFLSGLRPASVLSLPAAAAHSGVLLRQADKLWYSDGALWSDLAQTGAGGGSGATLLPATITVPWASGGGATNWNEAVAVAGLTSGSRISAALAATPDIDENDVEELENVLLSASYLSPGVASISAAFKTPVTGPINLLLTVF